MPGKGAFKRCVEKVSRRKGVDDPRAVCASSIGRKRGRTRGRVNAKKRKGYTPSDLAGAAKRLATGGLPLLNPGKAGSGPFSVVVYGSSQGGRSEAIVRRFKTRDAAERHADRLNDKAYQKQDYSSHYKVVQNPTRRNHHNDQAAIDAYKEFHGRDPEELIEFTRHVQYPGRTAAIGELVSLKVKVPAGRVEGSRIVKLSGFKGAMLTRHPREVQLYVEGGDQSLDLEEFGIGEPHGLEFLGEVSEITYYTRKDHLGSEGGEANYVHKFGVNEETGERTERPLLNYDVANEQLIFSGGGYTIPAEGIDG